MTSEYENFSFSGLQAVAAHLKIKIAAKQTEIKSADSESKTAMQKALAELLVERTEVLEALSTKQPEPSTHTEVSYDSSSQQTRHLNNLLSDVPRFDGANPIALVNFITQVDQIYDINVEGKDNSEPIFATAVKNRLSADVYNVLKNSGVETRTYCAL